MFVSRYASLILAGSLLSLTAAYADDTAAARYRQELSACNSGQSGQDMATCRTEARNALAASRRGRLANSEPPQMEQNAIQRCAVFQGDERSACWARIRQPDAVEGNVTKGGVLRESVEIVPAQTN